jgi:hypothetical protein
MDGAHGLAMTGMTAVEVRLTAEYLRCLVYHSVGTRTLTFLADAARLTTADDRPEGSGIWEGTEWMSIVQGAV